MKIEIVDTNIVERTVNHDKGSFKVREQGAFLFMSDEAKYPTHFTVQLGEGQKAHEPRPLQPRCFELFRESIWAAYLEARTLIGGGEVKQSISAKKVKELRNQKGLSQAELAKRIGIQRSYLSQFENGRMILSDNVLSQIEIELGALQTVNDEPNGDAQLLPRLCDGYLVAPAVREDDAEYWCEQIRELEEAFSTVAAEPLPTGWLGNIDEEKIRERHSDLMLISAKMMLLIKDLQGQTDHLYVGELGQGFTEMLTGVEVPR